MFKKRKKIAQTTAEYAIVIALVVGAVVAMQIYVRRGLQGRIKDAVDHTGISNATVGSTSFSFKTGQYEPYYTESTSATTQSSSSTDTLKEGGAIDRTSTLSADVNRTQTTGWKDYNK